MNYPFEYPECGTKQNISMSIQQYIGTGHYCPSCGTEMVREVKSLICGASINKCGGFYRDMN